MPYAILTVVLVALDQLVKYLVLQNIPLGGHVPFIPYIVELTYVQNTGAAFSSFQGMIWLFAVIFALLTAGIVWEYKKQALGLTKTEWWCIAAIYGGGLGNMIDRVRLGFVVDMIETRFIDFPVFNVADICVVCGAILMFIYIAFIDSVM